MAADDLVERSIIAVSISHRNAGLKICPTFWGDAIGSEKQHRQAVIKLLAKALFGLVLEQAVYRRHGAHGSMRLWLVPNNAEEE